MKPELIRLLKIAFKIGGPGSGHFGHAGRPGMVGGSAPSRGGGQPRAYSDGGRTGGTGEKRMDKLSKEMYGKPLIIKKRYEHHTKAEVKKFTKEILGVAMTPEQFCQEIGIPSDMNRVELRIERDDDTPVGLGSLSIEANFGLTLESVYLSFSSYTSGKFVESVEAQVNEKAPPGTADRYISKILEFANKHDAGLYFSPGGKYADQSPINRHDEWPSFGANGSLNKKSRDKLKKDDYDFYKKVVDDYFGEVKVQDVFNAPKIGNMTGKEWWKKNGAAFSFTLDPEQVKNAYQVNKKNMEAKGIYV